MNAETYKATLDVTDLLRELERLLLVQHRTDRLICRYLADLADGIVQWPALLLAYGDVYEFVRAKFGLSLRSTRERVRVGRALRTLPVLDAALTSGQITYSRIREVTRVAEPDTERVWLHAAQRLSVRALERRVVEAGGKSQAGSRQPQRKHASEPGHVSVSVPREVWAQVIQAMHVANAAHDSELSNWQALAEVARSAIAYHASTDRPFAPSGHMADQKAGSTPSGEAGEPRASAGASRGPTELTELTELTDDETAGQLATHSGSREIDGAEAHFPAAGELPTHRARPSAEFSTTRARPPAATTTKSSAAPGAETEGPRWGGVTRTPDGFGGPTPARERDPGVVAPLTDTRGRALSADVRLLYALIATGGDWNAVTLGEATGMPSARLVTALVDLEFAQLVNRDVMGFFEVRQKQAG